MKKIAIRIGLLLTVFTLVVVGVYLLQNREENVDTIQMEAAGLPVVYMMYEEQRINCLHGYSREIDAASQRESLTPLPENRIARMEIDTYGNRITGISYEVRTLNQDRLLEKTVLDSWDTEGKVVRAQLPIENLIEENTEYLLTVRISSEEEPEIVYYTRILLGMEKVREKLSYVQDFSQKTFDKEEAESLTMYLESGSKGDNTNFGKVNIYSSFDQITWGKLAPVRITEPVPVITEVDGNITSMVLSYEISAQNMYGTTEYYNIREFYRTNYTETRTYLLNFERTMKQQFKAASDNVTGSRINLGISVDTDKEVLTNEKGNLTAFVSERELWTYEKGSNRLTCVFSFQDKGDDGVRDSWNQHEIELVRVEDNGNVYFVVYGYMNRGPHEGEVGITLYRYAEETHMASEILFVPYEKSFAYLKQTLGNLFYITDNNRFCFLLEGNLYSVDLASREYMLIVEGLKEGCYVTNRQGNMIAWQLENEPYGSSQIKELKLDTNQENIISGNGDMVRVVGFIENDLVYGTAKQEDIRKTVNGSTQVYMSGLYIVDADNRLAGSYKKEGYYFTEANIRDNMITLTRFRKTESGSFVEAEEDYITNNTVSVQAATTVTMIATELKKKEAGINLPTSSGETGLKVEYTKEILSPEGRTLVLSELPGTMFSYYIYGKGELLDALDEASEAIRYADEEAGVVIDRAGSYIWKRGTKNTNKTLANVSAVDSEDISIVKALNSMLKFAGVSVDSRKEFTEGKTTIEIVNEHLGGRGLDLTGCTLKQVLYFIDTDRPVLAKKGEDSYVLIVGFDAYNAILLDFETQTSYKIGLEDGTELFRLAGNEFISYGP